MQHEVEIIRGFVGAADLVDAFHLFYPPSSMDNVIVTSLKETYGAADTECYQSPERAQIDRWRDLLHLHHRRKTGAFEKTLFRPPLVRYHCNTMSHENYYPSRLLGVRNRMLSWAIILLGLLVR